MIYHTAVVKSDGVEKSGEPFLEREGARDLRGIIKHYISNKFHSISSCKNIIDIISVTP